MAEREGFEPPEPCGSAVFKTAAIDHSATSPFVRLEPIVLASQRQAAVQSKKKAGIH
jgi:hypothetical protein